MIAALSGARVALSGIKLAIVAFVLLLLVGLAAVQTVRLEGFKVWPISVEGSLAKNERLEGEIKAILDAQKDAGERQQAVNEGAEQAYEDIAEGIDDAFETALGGELDAAARFIAASRVRCPAVGGSPGRAGPAAGDNGAGVSEGASQTPELDAAGGAAGDSDLVAVPADDVKICTVNTLQAETGRAWAISIEAASRTPADSR